MSLTPTERERNKAELIAECLAVVADEVEMLANELAVSASQTPVKETIKDVLYTLRTNLEHRKKDYEQEAEPPVPPGGVKVVNG